MGKGGNVSGFGVWVGPFDKLRAGPSRASGRTERGYPRFTLRFPSGRTEHGSPRFTLREPQGERNTVRLTFELPQGERNSAPPGSPFESFRANGSRFPPVHPSRASGRTEPGSPRFTLREPQGERNAARPGSPFDFPQGER